MDQQLKDKWTTALRSGLYEQACGSLMQPAHAHKGVGYCCLGVLICISGEYRPGQLREGCQDADYRFVESLVGGKEMRGMLASMNDFEHKSFAEIADYIERAL